jgi:hypothetical protein
MSFSLIARSPQGGVPVGQLFKRFCVPTVTFPRMKKSSGSPSTLVIGNFEHCHCMLDYG